MFYFLSDKKCYGFVRLMHFDAGMDQVGGGYRKPLPRIEKSSKSPFLESTRGTPLSRRAKLGGLYFWFFRGVSLI